MIAPDRVFSVNDHLVASDVVDGEAVIINLSNGMYFTMDKVGAEVWHLLGRPRSVPDVAGILAGRYAVSEREILQDVDDVVSGLLGEQLIIEARDPGGAPTDDATGTLPAVQPTYSKPVLTKYTDMSEVLALDPPLPELSADLSSQS